jgi:hypothetical protein
VNILYVAMVALLCSFTLDNSHTSDCITERRPNLSKQVKRCVVVGTEDLQLGHCIRHSFDHERPPSHNRQSRTSHSRTPLGQLHPLDDRSRLPHEAVHVFLKAKPIVLQPELVRAFGPSLLLPVHFLYALLHHFFIPGLQC